MRKKANLQKTKARRSISSACFHYSCANKQSHITSHCISFTLNVKQAASLEVCIPTIPSSILTLHHCHTSLCAEVWFFFHLLNGNIGLFCLTACWFWTGPTTALSLQSNLAGSPFIFCPVKTGALSALARRYRSVDYIRGSKTLDTTMPAKNKSSKN